MKTKKKVKKTKKRYGIYFHNGDWRSEDLPKAYTTKTAALKAIDGYKPNFGYSVKEIA